LTPYPVAGAVSLFLFNERGSVTEGVHMSDFARSNKIRDEFQSGQWANQFMKW